MHVLFAILVVLGCLAVMVLAALLLARAMMRAPRDLGPAGGRLRPCPDTPNCVCSQADDEAHHVEPIAFDGDIDAARQRIRMAVASLPRGRVVAVEGPYVRAEFATVLFRFVDDVEFLICPEEKVIHVRSASRVGYSDFGVNRTRVARLHRAFAHADG